MTNTVEQAFWKLLKAGLWERAPIIETKLTGEQWAEVMEQAKRQTLLGVLFDGMLRLPLELQPEEEIRMKWFWRVNKIEQANRKLNRVLVEFTDKLQEQGISSLMLKGQSYAVLYPQPLHRQCGDIDLFIGMRNYERVCNLVREWGISGIENDESPIHLQCFWQGVTIELHRKVSNIPRTSRHYPLLDWCESELEDSEAYFTPHLENTRIRIPSPTFNVVYVFFHLYQHFLITGVGLRQLCDWARLLHAYKDEYDIDILEQRLDKLGLLHPWRVFGTLLVEYLGLPQEDFPLYLPDEKKAEKVMSLIERDGNFGETRGMKKPKSGSYTWRKIKRFVFNSSRYPSVIRLFPRDTIYGYVSFVTDRGKLFLDHFRKQ